MAWMIFWINVATVLYLVLVVIRSIYLRMTSCKRGFHKLSDVLVDKEARRCYQICPRCKAEWQFDFQKEIPENWIVYCTGENQCPTCYGWKPQAWSHCSGTYCERKAIFIAERMRGE